MSLDSSYQELEREFVVIHGLREGDKIRVVSKATHYQMGWDNVWATPMNNYIRKVGTFAGFANTGPNSGITLLFEDEDFDFPFFVLQPLKRIRRTVAP